MPIRVPIACRLTGERLAVYGTFETRRVPRSEPILATKCPGRRYPGFAATPFYEVAMLILSDVTYRIEKRRLLDHASVQIPDGAKVGLVGRNGVGKSTLFNLIRGVSEPEDGTIELPGSRRIGFLAQEAPSGPATPFETVLAADRERTRLLSERETNPPPLRAAEIETRLLEIDAYSAPGRAGRILAGLGLNDAMQQRPLADLSGGWRMRVALGRSPLYRARSAAAGRAHQSSRFRIVALARTVSAQLSTDIDPNQP